MEMLCAVNKYVIIFIVCEIIVPKCLREAERYLNGANIEVDGTRLHIRWIVVLNPDVYEVNVGGKLIVDIPDLHPNDVKIF